jgi:hypothetical protein
MHDESDPQEQSMLTKKELAELLKEIPDDAVVQVSVWVEGRERVFTANSVMINPDGTAVTISVDPPLPMELLSGRLAGE